MLDGIRNIADINAAAGFIALVLVNDLTFQS